MSRPCGVAMAVASAPAVAWPATSHVGREDEEALQGRTYEMLGRHEQMQKDREFLQHYMQAAAQGAIFQEAQSREAESAFAEQDKHRKEVQKELDAARAELAARRAELWSCRNALANTEHRVAELGHRRAVDAAALRNQLGVADSLAQNAAMQAAALGSALTAARIEAEGQKSAACSSAAFADGLDAALAEAQAEMATRDEIAGMVMQQALSRLENDIARERQVLLARERTKTRRIHELEGLVGGVPGMLSCKASSMGSPVSSTFMGVDDTVVSDDASATGIPSLPSSPLGRPRGDAAKDAAALLEHVRRAPERPGAPVVPTIPLRALAQLSSAQRAA